jgi:hypothetical protein
VIVPTMPWDLWYLQKNWYAPGFTTSPIASVFVDWPGWTSRSTCVPVIEKLCSEGPTFLIDNPWLVETTSAEGVKLKSAWVTSANGPDTGVADGVDGSTVDVDATIGLPEEQEPATKATKNIEMTPRLRTA